MNLNSFDKIKTYIDAFEKVSPKIQELTKQQEQIEDLQRLYPQINEIGKQQEQIKELLKSYPYLETFNSINLSDLNSLKDNLSTLENIKGLDNLDEINTYLENIEDSKNDDKDLNLNPFSLPKPVDKLSNLDDALNTLIKSNNEMIKTLIDSNKNLLEQKEILQNIFKTSVEQFQSSEKQTADTQKFNNKIFWISIATLTATIVMPILLLILT